MKHLESSQTYVLVDYVPPTELDLADTAYIYSIQEMEKIWASYCQYVKESRSFPDEICKLRISTDTSSEK